MPSHLQVNTSQLGYYSPDDRIKQAFVKWTIGKQREVYKWLEIMWIPLIPIPVPLLPFQYSYDVYRSYTGWRGDCKRLLDILMEIENKIQETYGIAYEAWTIPIRGAKTFLEDHSYNSGCGAQNLRECLESVYIQSKVLPNLAGL